MKNKLKKDLKGAIHNHCSDYSGDATESFDVMVKNAKAAGLDFIIFTDHNSVGLKNSKRDLNYNGLQAIAGTEITPECKFARFEDKEFNDKETSGHFLIFDLDELPSDELINKGVSQEVVDFANSKGLLGFIAHPDHKGAKAFGVPSYRCKNFDITNYTGFSLWDLQTDCQNYAKDALTALTMAFFPTFTLKGPEQETLQRWDEQSKRKGCSIIGELDQHAYQYKFFGINFTIFKSALAFRTILTHVILKEPVDTDNDFKGALLTAMKKGHTYVSCDYFKDASGFTFEAEHNGARYVMGETVEKKSGKATFDVQLPAKGEIRLIQNGKVCLKEYAKSLSFSTEEKGVYRVEASLKAFFKLRPWIYSNTIRVV